jgi:hypothetical protein
MLKMNVFTAAKHYLNNSEMKNFITYDMLKHFLFRVCLLLISNQQRHFVNRAR